ncbi:MAG: type II toxin-antitoxin system HicA family toxin [Anditalea sp.]
MSIKSRLFIKHLGYHGCHLHRHGSNHDIYRNAVTGKKSAVPRHSKLDRQLAKLICKQLEIPFIEE